MHLSQPFTDADVRLTKRTIRADPKLRAMTAGRTGYSIGRKVGSFADEDGNPIGAFAGIALRRRLTLRTTIPVLCFPKHGYLVVPVEWKFANARVLHVHVDFSRHRIIGFIPEEGTLAGPPPNIPRACAANAEPPGY